MLTKELFQLLGWQVEVRHVFVAAVFAFCIWIVRATSEMRKSTTKQN